MFNSGTSQLTTLAHEAPALSYTHAHPTAIHRTLTPQPVARTPPPPPLHAEAVEHPQQTQQTLSASRRQPPPPARPPSHSSHTRSGSASSGGNVVRLGFSSFLDYFSGPRAARHSTDNPYAHVTSQRRRAACDHVPEGAATGTTYNLRSTSPTAVERERRQLRDRAAAAAEPGGLSLSDQEPYLRRLRYHARHSGDSASLADVQPLTRSQSFASRESSIAELPRCLSTDYTALAGGLEPATAYPFPAIAGCMVCLSRFKDEEEVVELPCGHPYHINCIVRWLSRKATCPYCRTALKSSRKQQDQ